MLPLFTSSFFHTYLISLSHTHIQTLSHLCTHTCGQFNAQAKLEFLDAPGGTTTAAGAGGGDSAPRNMMKRFKFKVYNPVAITTTHRQVLAAGCGAGPRHSHMEEEVGARQCSGVCVCVEWLVLCVFLDPCPVYPLQKPQPCPVLLTFLIAQQVLIQAQVKNITERHTALMLEDVAFVAEDGLVAEPLPNVVDDNHAAVEASHQPVSPSRLRRLARSTDGAAVADDDGDACDCVRAFDRHVYLQPDDVVQFLYRLRRAGSYKGCAMVLAPGMPLGCVRCASCMMPCA